MEKEKIDVLYHLRAKDSIRKISEYIEENGYPVTAEKFAKKLYDFGDSLNVFPERYPIYRHEKFRKRGLRCAVFHKNYIFAYKVTKNKVSIYNVIHGKTLK